MKALDRKLIRDLWQMKGQILAISIVIVGGVSTFVMLKSTMDSLYRTRARFYKEYRFADVFGTLKRAPDSVKSSIAEIPGVDKVETRIVADVKLDIKGFGEPVTARLVSIPDEGKPLLNGVYLRKGRTIEVGKDDEVIVNEAFAEAHSLKPGDTFGAIINGKKKELVVTGIGLSPEFVMQIRPGGISPDFKRYGILWIGRSSLESAYDMKGAFNSVVLTVEPGTRPEDVIVRLDDILDRYGGLGAISRENQISHRFLNEEFRQLQASARIFPAIFIGVAAFLLNVVLSRLVSTQRDQIAILKAFGYTNLAIGLHYLRMVTVVILVGISGGIAVGVWFGRALGNVYMEFYRFPYLLYELAPSVVITASLITIAASVAGTLHSVLRAAKLPPAEAMRPEPPARYKETVLERIGFQRFLSQPTRMILRNIERRPVKSILSIIGIAFACGIMIAARFSNDAINYMIEIQFRLARRDDIAITFFEPVSRKVMHELRSVRGIGYTEVFRTVPVRLRSQHRSFRTIIQGMEPESRLHRLIDVNLRPIPVPQSGIVLTDYLGKLLRVKPGDTVTVEVLEGRRGTYEVPVVNLVEQYIGLSGYMDLSALNRLLREGDAVSGAYMTADSLYMSEIYRSLIDMPSVVGSMVRREEIRNFYDTQARVLLFFTFVASILAGSIAFGVVYNSARIALSERSRELASLRVLGYTRGEISYILLGELAILTIAAIPLGFWVGRGLCLLLVMALQSELYRVPLVVERGTYALGAAVVLVSAAVSSLIVRRRLDRLDLVAVLKTKE